MPISAFAMHVRLIRQRGELIGQNEKARDDRMIVIGQFKQSRSVCVRVCVCVCVGLQGATGKCLTPFGKKGSGFEIPMSARRGILEDDDPLETAR